ncbi:pyridoxal phosphate-dependent aminotransferase [Pinibacter aurantiacus]|nr:histidinol-phosphate transaminase [Pinibacter aurantiacus]
MTMQRREMLRNTALAAAAFAFSRDTFARKTESRIITNFPPSKTMIRLGFNENPYGPSPMARKAMMEAVTASNRYPMDAVDQLRVRIGKEYNLNASNVVIGAGSSELLGIVGAWTVLKKGTALVPEVSFLSWTPAAKKIGLDIKTVPLTGSRVIDLNGMKNGIESNTKLIYLCNPNNPTGTVLPPNELEAFIRNVAPSCPILLDEAYTEFNDTPSMAKLVNEFPNLLVAKTFSKVYGMAGARLGYILAHPQTISEITSLQPWANASASAVSLAGALASMDDKNFVNYCKTENTKAKEIFYNALKKANISYIPSSTNFVYFNCENYPKDIVAQLEAKGIAGIRTYEKNTRWCRLTIGTVEEMGKVAEALLI